MRSKFLGVFYQIYFDEQYYTHYQMQSERILLTIRCVLIAFSCSSVGAFVTYVTESIPDLFSTVWFVVVTLVQVVGSIEFLFPYQDRISALGYLLPEIRLLLNEVEYCWNEIDCGKLTSGEIAEKIKEFKHSKISIEQKYAGSSFFPRKEKLEDLARRDADIYIEDFSHRSFQ